MEECLFGFLELSSCCRKTKGPNGLVCKPLMNLMVDLHMRTDSVESTSLCNVKMFFPPTGLVAQQLIRELVQLNWPSACKTAKPQSKRRFTAKGTQAINWNGSGVGQVLPVGNVITASIYF